MSRFQFVWWWSLAWGFERMAGNWAKVYRWRLWLGPLEIRRWADGARALP